MWNWVRKVFKKESVSVKPVVVPRPPSPDLPAPSRHPTPVVSPASVGPPPGKDGGGRTFLLALVHEAEPKDLQELAPDDRIYLSGVMRLLREKAFDIPVLPQAALEISKLLANPDTKVDEYVRVLAVDPSLSIEVLRTANSAYYGFGRQTHSVKEAIVRVGLSQVRGLLVVAHLKGRVLQGGAFHREAGWLSDFSLAFAHLCRYMARDLGLTADAAFTRGLLYHIEHFILLGSLGQVSKEHKKKVRPSDEGLMEAFRRCGDRVRIMAARSWDLEELLEGFGEGVESRIERLRHSLVLHSVGAPVEAEDAAGLDYDHLVTALEKVAAMDGAGKEAG